MNTQFLNTSGGQIAYEVSGSGPLVVCVPGMGDLRAEYRFLTPLLVQAGFRVASMDVRGHGESSTRWSDFTVAGVGSDILALIRELGTGPAYIIGASMAAGAAIWAAAEAPALVSGIALLGPAARGKLSWWMRALLRRFADAGGTVLLSSHLLHEVQQIADDLVMIGNGRVVAQGSVADLLSAGRSLEDLYLELAAPTARTSQIGAVA